MDLVVSLRHGDESLPFLFGIGLEVEGLAWLLTADDLEKKPRILLCLPVDEAMATFLEGAGVLAGVPACAPGVAPMVGRCEGRVEKDCYWEMGPETR